MTSGSIFLGFLIGSPVQPIARAEHLQTNSIRGWKMLLPSLTRWLLKIRNRAAIGLRINNRKISLSSGCEIVFRPLNRFRTQHEETHELNPIKFFWPEFSVISPHCSLRI